MIKKQFTGAVDLQKLQREIKDHASIPTVINHISMIDDGTTKTVRMYFDWFDSHEEENEMFATSEETAIDGLVGTHDGAPFTGDNWVMYENMDTPPVDKSILNKDTPFSALKYRKKLTFDKGHLLKIEYFQDYDKGTDTYSSLAIEETNDYTIVDGEYNEKTTSVLWYKENGEASTPKTWTKNYTPPQASVAGQKRRTNIINQMKPNIIDFIMTTDSVTKDVATASASLLFKAYTTEIMLYENGIKQDLIDAITSDATHAWLDNDIGGAVTIRDYILSKINYID